MAVTFPEVRVGDAIHYENLFVFPLFAEPREDVEYVLSHEAIDSDTVTVEEVSEGGSVPELTVENEGDTRVLFLEGEELVGAKQNRVLNTSVLVAASSRSMIPVSCVEAGRWGYRSRRFGSGGTHSPSKLRRVLKASVSQSLREKRGYRSDQSEVWDEVSRQQLALCASSETTAMSDTFETHRARLDEFHEKLQYVDGAVGAAVALNGSIVTLDLFDKTTTCQNVWDRLLSGVILDALEATGTSKQVAADEAERVVSMLTELPWEPADPIGEGEQYRAESTAGDHASALVLDDTLVHTSMVCGCP